jgi:hypothetical protein
MGMDRPGIKSQWSEAPVEPVEKSPFLTLILQKRVLAVLSWNEAQPNLLPLHKDKISYSRGIR